METKPPVALLVIAIVLALIGIGGVATGAADSDSDDAEVAGSKTTTTTEASSDTSSLVTVTVPTTLATTTTRKTTATTKPSTGTTQATGACATAVGSGNPGPAKAPALGTYSYASCTTPDKIDIVVTAGESGGGITRRNIQTQSQLGNLTAHDAFGPNGVVQETTTVVAFGFTLQCDWKPDITEYPAALAVGTTWSADTECNLGNGAKMHATGTRKITGVGTVVVGGTTVTAWVIDETQKLVITAPNRSPTNFSTTSTDYYDPTRGIILYEKAVSEATGSVAQPKTTTEIHLTNLSPKT